jgi:hypothetical protein
MPSPPRHNPGEISRKIAEFVLADEIKKLPEVAEDKTIDPKTFSAFTGRYDYKNGILRVTTEGGHLFAQLTGQPKFEIFPKSPNTFFWKVTDAQVVFLRDNKDQVVAAQHTQGGGTFRAPRLDETVKLSRKSWMPSPGSINTDPTQS